MVEVLSAKLGYHLQVLTWEFSKINTERKSTGNAAVDPNAPVFLNPLLQILPSTNTGTDKMGFTLLWRPRGAS